MHEFNNEYIRNELSLVCQYMKCKIYIYIKSIIIILLLVNKLGNKCM
jgi:hypothetical protein